MMEMLIKAFVKRHVILVPLFVIVFSPSVYGEYADVTLNKRAEKAGMRPVIFPHWFHRIRFTCNVCHNSEGFIMQAGANDITMAGLVDGKFCGMCHNSVIAWGLDRCDTCHSGLPGLATDIKRGDQTRGPGRL